MIVPSISFDNRTTPPMWRHCSLEDVEHMIRDDVAELTNLLHLRAEDQAEAAAVGRRPDIRLINLIRASERAQDAHFSWYKEIQDARTTAAHRPSGLGAELVGPGN